MEFASEMDEVEEYLRSKKYPELVTATKLLGGHVGKDKIIDRVMQRYWWRNVTADVSEKIIDRVMQRYWWRNVTADVSEKVIDRVMQRYWWRNVRCQKASTVFKKVDPKLHNVPIKPQNMNQIGVALCSLPTFTVQASMKFSPFKMLYGREPVLPIDVDHELADCTLNLDDPKFEESDFHATLSKREILQDAVFKKAEANIEQAQAKQQADFAEAIYTKEFYCGRQGVALQSSQG
ncbi:hypothetical protein O3P69_019917 [Scylla paramamosain]|uniref:Uncharacterized protein n=1 Tax=Scylla paramamosain TaxID=85552 RepID=A0AAW0SK76_SCYPA